MSTTAIFAEILVSGVQTLAWLLLLTASVSGIRWPASILTLLQGWAALITIALVAVAYALGTVSDRLADHLFDSRDRSLRGEWFETDDAVGTARLRVAHASDSLARYLEYIRSRLRVARATAFNSIGFFLAFVVAGLSGLLPLRISATSALVVLVIGFFAAYAWRDASKMFYRRLAQAAELLDRADRDRPI